MGVASYIAGRDFLPNLEIKERFGDKWEYEHIDGNDPLSYGMLSVTAQRAQVNPKLYCNMPQVQMFTYLNWNFKNACFHSLLLILIINK